MGKGKDELILAVTAWFSVCVPTSYEVFVRLPGAISFMVGPPRWAAASQRWLKGQTSAA